MASAFFSSLFSLDPSLYSLGSRDPGFPRSSGWRTSAHALLSFWEALPQHFLFFFLLPFSGKHQCPQRGLPLYLIFSGFPVVFRCLFLCFPPYIYPLNKACNDFCCCVYLFFIRNLSLSGFSGEGNDNLLQYSCS